jgi:hypothetical protein
MLKAPAVLVQHEMLQPAGGSIHDHVLVHFAFFVSRFAGLEKAKVVAGEVAAVLDGLAQEVCQAIDVVAGRGLRCRVAPRDHEQFIAQLRRDGLVGIEDENPVGGDGQVGERPVLLPRIAQPRLHHNGCAVLTCNLTRAIAALAVYDKNLVGPRLRTLDGKGQIDLFVERRDDDGDVAAHAIAAAVRGWMQHGIQVVRAHAVPLFPRYRRFRTSLTNLPLTSSVAQESRL